MQTSTGDFTLTMDELRAVAGFALGCAAPVVPLFEKSNPTDARPAAALAAARLFVDGAPRSKLQRVAAADAHRAAGDAADEVARHAALAARDAGAAAYLHPLATRSQLAHILGAGAHAARATELARDDDDPVVAEYVLTAAAKRADQVVREVLSRYPRPSAGTTRMTALLARLDHLILAPPRPARVVDDPGPFFHGTRADLKPGDLLTAGWASNYGTRRAANHTYVTASDAGAPLAAAMAAGDGAPRVYRVEPLGTLEDDPNVTDKRFPGNPTRSYRTREPVRIVEEVHGWTAPDPGVIESMKRRMAELTELGIEAMDD